MFKWRKAMFGRDKEKTTTTTSNTQNNTFNSPPQTANINPVSSSSPKIETVIGPNCHFKGTIQSDGGIKIEGIVEGNIQTTGNLVVSESATVIAEVQAYNVSVSGSLKGNLTANKVEITESGKVWGDLNVNSLLLHEGAYLKGSTNMGGAMEPPMIEAPRIVTKAAVIENGVED
jgi:cytoskeletal protein CcmA (bactofilin family)